MAKIAVSAIKDLICTGSSIEEIARRYHNVPTTCVLPQGEPVFPNDVLWVIFEAGLENGRYPLARYAYDAIYNEDHHANGILITKLLESDVPDLEAIKWIDPGNCPGIKFKGRAKERLKRFFPYELMLL